MSIVHLNVVSALSPAVTPIWPPGPGTNDVELLLVGADGIVDVVKVQTHAGTIVSIQDQAGSVVVEVEVEDAAVAAETATAVTLEFGD